MMIYTLTSLTSLDFCIASFLIVIFYPLNGENEGPASQFLRAEMKYGRTGVEGDRGNITESGTEQNT